MAGLLFFPLPNTLVIKDSLKIPLPFFWYILLPTYLYFFLCTSSVEQDPARFAVHILCGLVVIWGPAV